MHHDGLVPRQDAELARPEALSELREIEGRGVATGSAPELRRDGYHGPTMDLARVARPLRDTQVSATVDNPVDIGVTKT